MAKPTRKNPGINTWTETPQGKEFLSFIVVAIGKDLRWEALDQTRDGKFVFYLEGGAGWGMLVEEKEQPEGECWRERAAFRCLTESGFILDATLTAYRWDAGLSAKANGDNGLIEGSPSRRRRLSAQRRAEIGTTRDILECKWRLPADAPAEVLGVPAAHLEALKARRDSTAG